MGNFKFKNLLIALICVIALFGIFNINVFAAEDGNTNNGGLADGVYNITNYKAAKFADKYHKDEYVNIDYVCSSGSDLNAEPCDVERDPSIHVYYAWVVSEDLEPFSDQKQSSFSKKAFYFGTSIGATWREYSNSNNPNATTASWGGAKSERLRYVTLYLHRYTIGFNLYENRRTEQYYTGIGSPDNVVQGSPAYTMTVYNGAFEANNTMLVYNTVPHVLGSEGQNDNLQVISVMEEVNGIPIPVLAGDNYTGLCNIQYDDGIDINTIKSQFPIDKNNPNNIINSSYTSLAWANSNDSKAPNSTNRFTYVPFTVRIPGIAGTIPGVETDDVPIDKISGLVQVIDAMGGPQYVGSIQIALDEAIAVRNSAYAFMASMGNNGNYQWNTSAGNAGSNEHPENYYGVYYMRPRIGEFYVNGSNTNETNISTIRINRSVPTGNMVTFKHSTTTTVRSACYSKDGVRCSRLVLANYYNDIEVTRIRYSDPKDGSKDKYYNAYKIIPGVGSCVSGNDCRRTGTNTGYSTFYYDEIPTHFYSAQNNAWGTWRQIGWSSGMLEMGSIFAADVTPFPKSPTQGNYDLSNISNARGMVLRFPWHNSGSRAFKIEPIYNKPYLNQYMARLGGSTVNEFNRYEEMTDLFLMIVKTDPALLYKTFYLGQQMLGNAKYPPLTIGSTETGKDYDGYGTCTSIDSGYNNNKCWGYNNKTYPAVPPETINAIAAKIAENVFGTTNVTSFAEFYNYSINHSTEGDNSWANKFPTAWLAVNDALSTKDANNITYAEHMAYIFWNYYGLVSFPDEYTNGMYFSTRRASSGATAGSYYSFENILALDKSNVAILNAETRLHDPVVGDTTNGVASGTPITAVTDIPIGTRYGTELYVVNGLTGDIYSPGATTSGGDPKCPSGWIQEGTKCRRTLTQNINTGCPAGYVFNWTDLKCHEIASGVVTCPDGYNLIGSYCETENGTTPDCTPGHWDKDLKMCIDHKDAYCPSGYTKFETNIADSIIRQSQFTWTFDNTVNDISQFHYSGVTDVIQHDAASIRFKTTGNQGSLEITGLDIDKKFSSLVELKMRNDTDAQYAKIYYKTDRSNVWNEAKSVTIKLEADRNLFYTYVVDMSGGYWTESTWITGLRIVPAVNASQGGTVYIDQISVGSQVNNYDPIYKCFKDFTPVCPVGMEYDDVLKRCRGLKSELAPGTMLNSYELTCDHITPELGETVTLSTYKVGDYVNFNNSAAFSIPATGVYYIEAWGASTSAGDGGYTAGAKYLTEGQVVYFNIGNQNNGSSNTIVQLTTSGSKGEILATANTGIAGINNLDDYKLTKSGTEWFKKTTDIGSGAWTGERGHEGNGYGRITLMTIYSNVVGGGSAANVQLKSTTNNKVNTFNYSGTVQQITLAPGNYTFEAWGASGGIGYGKSNPAGLGGYTKATLDLETTQTFYVYVGEQGIDQNEQTTRFNGGGAAHETVGHNGGAGGGASDVRLVSGSWNNVASLQSRIFVAGGGGGAQSTCGSRATAGHGGGLTGVTSYNLSYQGRDEATARSRAYSTGGTQTSPGYGYNVNDNNQSVVATGTFGAGVTSTRCGAGGGGGYYGGGSAYTSGGGGGSSFVTGYAGADTTYRGQHNGITFTNVKMEQGVHTGNGKVVITNNNADLGYYISAPADAIQLGSCIRSKIGVPAGIGLEMYKGNLIINACDYVPGPIEKCEDVLKTKTETVSQTYGYTGKIQSVTLQPGTYTFEVYGAQGGNAKETYTGGLGGYSKATYTINKPTTVFLVVGSAANGGTPGWNGGGAPGNANRLAGGGASHIALSGGLLKDLAGDKSSVLIVAGGGGGAGDDDGTGLGGAGGGANMNGGNGGSDGFGDYGRGGTLTAGGAGGVRESGTYAATAGSFGQGGNGYSGSWPTNGAAGGGGGYYGGGGAIGDLPQYNDYDDKGAGGGSGYANTTLLTNISGNSGVNAGNGKIVITGTAKYTYTERVCTSTAPELECEEIITENKTDVNRTFTYTGAYEKMTLKPGKYTIETWGAEGGNVYGTGGKGGYSRGEITITETKDIYVFVGQQPTTIGTGGWNGGSKGGTSPSSLVYNSAGGGASDVRLGGTALSDRIIVAGGGGGGANYVVNIRGGAGGGNPSGYVYYSTYGVNVETKSNNVGANNNNNQTNQDTGHSYAINTNRGSLGNGAYGSGGGYYGGTHYTSGNRVYAGGGGTGYTNDTILTSTINLSGTETMPAPNGGTQTGHSGNGFVRITGQAIDVQVDRKCNYNTVESNQFEILQQFDFSGRVEKVVLQPGTYHLEAWGASGGDSNSPAWEYVSSHAGKGGYSWGTLVVPDGQTRTLYVAVGGRGYYGAGTNAYGGTTGGYNGGGAAGNSTSGGGGGASDIAIGYTAQPGSNVGSPGLYGGVTANGNKWVMPSGGYIHLHTGYNGLGRSHKGDVWRVDINGTGLENLSIAHSYNKTTNLSNQAWAGGDVSWLKTTKSSNNVQLYVKANEDWASLALLITNSGSQTATIESVDFVNLNERILVAGGGGGADNSASGAVGTGDDGHGGAGGGLVGGNPGVNGIVSNGVATYTANNGMYLRDGTTSSGGTAYTNAANEGVYGPYKTYTPRQTLTITVKGTGLTNGYPTVYTNYGRVQYTNGNGITITKHTDTEVVYRFDVPTGLTSTSNNVGTTYDSGVDPYTIWEFNFHASNANAMSIASTNISYTPGTIYNAIGAGQNYGYELGLGQNVGANTDSGGGGGGWYGGFASSHNNGGGGGGSGYVSSTLTESGMQSGVHLGNGQVKITGIITITSSDVNDICTDEAQLIMVPNCPNGTKFDVTINRCRDIKDLLCDAGYTYDEKLDKCTKAIVPTKCTNGGIVKPSAPGYTCILQATPQCDPGYTFTNGFCKKDHINVLENELCINGFEYDAANQICIKEQVIDATSINGTPLTESLNRVEIGKVYMLRNYVGFKASAQRGLDYLYVGRDENDNEWRYVRSAAFPAIELEMTLVDQEIGPTDQCYDATKESCAMPAYKQYKINLGALKGQLGNPYDKLFSGNRNQVLGGTQFSSTIPGNLSIGGESAADFVWSDYHPADVNFITNNDFSPLYSAIDVYFMFEEDKFCYYNAPSGEKVNITQMTCIDYVADTQGIFTVVKDGKVQLNTETDQDGNIPAKTIFIRSKIGMPNSYVDHDLKDLRALAESGANASAYVQACSDYHDNNIYKDDNAAYIAGFKLAPDSDVFIDRVEIYEADSNVRVFAADAMTADRCSNGYAIDAGPSTSYTETYSSQGYDGGSRSNPGVCKPFDPTEVKIALDPAKNYYVKTYSRHISLDEQEIAAGIPAEVGYIALDIKNIKTNGTSGSAFSTYISNLASTVNSDYFFTVRSAPDIQASLNGYTSANVSNGGLTHKSYAIFSPVEGMITAKNSDKSFRVGKTAISNITTFFRLNPNNGTVSSTSTLGQPYNVMTIPAEGLMAKGVNQGTYQITISGESALINAYSTWDVFPINYYLGESPDVAVKLYMKCYYNGGLVADFMQKEGTCVQINQNGIQRCELWAYAQNVNHQGNPVDTKIRADVDTNLNRKLDANTGSILGNAGSDPQGNKYWITNTGNYVHVKLRNVSTAETSIYAAAAHLSSDNGGYADVNWSNNYDESCFLFNSVDYGISETKFSVDRITNNATATTTNLTGTFNVTKFHDITVGNGSRQINVTYQLKNERTGATINCATVNPTTITSSGIDGTMQTYNFSIRCTIPAADKNRNDVLTLVVKINGGKTGTHAFSETTYDNNEDNATIRLMCQGSNCQPDDFYCDNRCVQSNTWSINYDFLYTFTRNVVSYKTTQTANMSWKDFDVGTVSGETEDLEYDAPIASGNKDRAPDDYMAFKSSTKNTIRLCTDYRAGNDECWRYENNVYHDVTYYLWSQAKTSVYTTHKTLSSSDDAGNCRNEKDTSRDDYNGENYGSANNGTGNTTHEYANSSNENRSENACHGYTDAPVSSKCTTVTDWWGNEICASHEPLYSGNANSGTHPTDYIPYSYFQDYTLSDGAGTSPTTKTDRIVLKSQKDITNGNQGANHEGWKVERTHDVCTNKAYMNISYKCSTYFRYGTYNNGTYFEGTKKGTNGYCRPAYYSDTTRTCDWDSTTVAPDQTIWWNDSGATCYRLHVDYDCKNYYGWSNSGYVNNSGNTTTGSCHWWQEGTITNKVSTTWKNSCYHSNYGNCTKALNDGYKCKGKDENGNPTDCGYTKHSHTSACLKVWYTDGTKCSWTLTWTNNTSENKTSSSECGQCGYTTYTKHKYEDSTASNISTYMERKCSNGDLEQGIYCYEKESDKPTETKDTERCIAWAPETYYEIKYYTTSSGTRDDWTSRTYKNPSEIWQYTCDTTEPTVPYPQDKNQLMTYKESISAVTYIKTERSGNQWVIVGANGGLGNNSPRTGEWFDLKFVSTYETSRGTKPGTMPYLQNFYNNYHNITGELGTENKTIYPSTAYKHYGVLDSGHLEIGDGKTVRPQSAKDIVNNEDYGYCNARPAEPYGCAYKSVGTQMQFAPDGDNVKVESQGHVGHTWISTQEGKGTCYYGPDNKTVWKKFIFGDDYEAQIEICKASDATGTNCPDGANDSKNLVSGFLVRSGETCNRIADGLCVSYSITWVPQPVVSNGKTHYGYFLDSDFDVQTALIIQISTDMFNAVGQYEKELLGTTTLSSGKAEKFFVEGNSTIKPLCACPSVTICENGSCGSGYVWGSTESEFD